MSAIHCPNRGRSSEPLSPNLLNPSKKGSDAFERFWKKPLRLTKILSRSPLTESLVMLLPKPATKSPMAVVELRSPFFRFG
jgi:hypothetical protein